jgi:hypothetical protein
LKSAEHFHKGYVQQPSFCERPNLIRLVVAGKRWRHSGVSPMNWKAREFGVAGVETPGARNALIEIESVGRGLKNVKLLTRDPGQSTLSNTWRPYVIDSS